MTPAARIAAACDILDRVLAGGVAEQVLTNWARGNRFAGSGDRAAIRDLVYDALRCRRSYARRGGSLTGRGLMLGHCAEQSIDPDMVFTGGRFAPAPLSPPERAAWQAAIIPQGLEALDCPDWLAPLLQDSLGADFAPVMHAQRHRAPVFVRVNLAHGSRPEAAAALALEGITAQPHPLAKSALEVTENARKIHTSQAYLQGLVEMQDAASQAMIEALPLAPDSRVLDYCAGGGGKVLALAARMPAQYFAHDIDPARMRDLPGRAERAGVAVEVLAPGQISGCFDLVVVDAPCSGSGTWRRTPEAKWRLTPERLAELEQVQAAILSEAAGLVRPGGVLAYMTCSLLTPENEAQRDRFLAAHPGWAIGFSRRLSPLDGGDGFFCTTFQRPLSPD